MRILTLTLSVILSVYTSVSYAQDPIAKGKQLFGGLKARNIGPALMSGRITDLELHPTNARIIYAGTAGGGVWKSLNGGLSFRSIFDDYTQSIGAIEIDPTNPNNVVWVGTGETWTRNSVSVGDGIYKTEDGGKNWKKMGLEQSERIASIQINPTNPKEIYVAALGALWNDSEDRGLYKTTDGGKTWKKILYVNSSTGCSDLILDPSDPNTIYAAFWDFRRQPWSFRSGGPGSALYKSSDGGKSFTKIHNGFPPGDLGRLAIAIAPSNPKTLYAVIEAKENKHKGLYQSLNGGQEWKQLNNDFQIVVRPFYFSRIQVDPRNPNIIVKAGLFGSISQDGGKTFKKLGPQHADIHDMAFDIHNSDIIYTATDGGIYRSWDQGTTFELVENIPVSQFYHISVDNEEPYNVYGGLQDNGSWYGPSASPGGIEARDWKYIGYGDGYRVFRHPTEKLIYSEMQGALSVWRYDITKNQAKTIQPLPQKIDMKLRFNWNAALAVSPNKPDRLYIGSQFLHRSDDRGENWTIISPDLTTNDPAKQNQETSGGVSRDNSGAENHCTIFAVAESPLDENVVWVGTDDGNVQVTQNGGKTWTNVISNVPDLPANTMIYHIEASVFNKGRAYVVFTGYQTGDKNPYLYKTNDFGNTWTSIATPEITSFVRNLQEDYVNENLLFVGAEFGLYITINGGKNWLKFTNNMPATSVHYIDLQRKTSDLVIGTHGRGIYIIDDISPLRKLTAENMGKDLFFFDTKPATISESRGFGTTSQKNEFVGKNPPKGSIIRYYLKKRHIIGKMTLHIEDKQGNKVMELAPTNSKGINMVTWAHNSTAPIIAKGKTFSRAGFFPRRVPADTYTAVLKKGKNTYTTKVVVQYDNTSNISLDDRKKQEAITDKLFNINQKLAYLVYTLDKYLASSDQTKQKYPKTKKQANAFIKELTALKEKLVITTGDNYVDRAEDQLREKLADLYIKVASSYYPPNSSDLTNMESLVDNFNKAEKEYEDIQKKYTPKLKKAVGQDYGSIFEMKSWEEFLKTSS